MKNQSFNLFFSLGAAACIALALCFLSGFHELWLDEANSYLIVKNTASWQEFESVFRYEGNPWLWFIMLRLLAGIDGSIAAMQIMHALIASCTVFVLLRYAPFPRWQTLLLVTGYFFMYEYALICRNYSAGVLLLFISCHWISRKGNVASGALITALCFQTHVHFFIVSLLLFAAFYGHELFPVNMKPVRRAVIAWIILGSGMALFLFQMRMAGNHGYFDGSQPHQDLLKILANVLLMPFRAFFHVADPFAFSRDANLIVHYAPWLAILLAVAAIGFPAVILRRHRTAFMFYYAAFFAICGASLLAKQPVIQLRHSGVIFIAFIAAWWLSETTPGRPFFPRIPFPGLLASACRYLLFFMLCAHAFSAVVAIREDILGPFSEGRNVADYIRERRLHRYPVVVRHHFSAPPVQAYLDLPVYYPERRMYSQYCIWNVRPFMMNTNDFTSGITGLPSDTLVLVSNAPVPGNFDGWHTLPLQSFSHSIVRSENFVVAFLVRAEENI